MELSTGDICTMKKPHPCGGRELAVERVGMDMRLRCIKCGREIWMLRSAFERQVRAVTPKQAQKGNTQDAQ